MTLTSTDGPNEEFTPVSKLRGVENSIISGVARQQVAKTELTSSLVSSHESSGGEVVPTSLGVTNGISVGDAGHSSGIRSRWTPTESSRPSSNKQRENPWTADRETEIAGSRVLKQNLDLQYVSVEMQSAPTTEMVTAEPITTESNSLSDACSILVAWVSHPVIATLVILVGASYQIERQRRADKAGSAQTGSIPRYRFDSFEC